MVKTWFITGISSGLGRKMTEQLLARGDRVAGTARRLDALDGLKSRHADELSVVALNVTHDYVSLRFFTALRLPSAVSSSARP